MRPTSGVLIGLLAATLLYAGPGLASAERDALSPSEKARLVERIGKGLDKKAYAHGVDFDDWPRHVTTHRRRLDAATSDGEFAAAINAALGEFGVSHLALYTPEDLAARRAGNRIGTGLKTVSVDDGRLVTLVLPGSPAALAGVERGDVLLSVGGKPAREVGAPRGLEGERVTIAWRRGDERHEATLTLAPYARALPLNLAWKDEGIAWMTINSFARDQYDRTTVEKFFSEIRSARGLVLDLRSNGGGWSENVEHLAAHVLPPGAPFIGEIHREQYDRYRKRHPRGSGELLDIVAKTGNSVRVDARFAGSHYEGSLAVLVDGRSGSGADMFPSVVQDNGRGPIIGSRTVGVVLGGDWLKLPYGFSLLLPQAELVRADGSRLEGHGVEPDILLTPEQTADDAVIEKWAMDALREAERK